jgi:hypothetical protein
LVKLEEFHHNFMQDIFATAESRSLLYKDSFFETVCDELISTGVVPDDLTNAYYQYLKGRLPMEVDGFTYDDEREILYIMTSMFFQEDTRIETLSSKIIEQKINRARNFILRSANMLYKDLEETAEEFVMSHFIFDKIQSKKVSKVRIILISDGKTSRSYKQGSIEDISGIPLESLIVDVEYLYNNYSAQNADSTFTVDIKLPCLPVQTGTDRYDSFLTYISGDQVFNIYDRFGKRLLEQNVRTFLQFKGGVNKGIRNTIDGAPNMFFAYNNGITATASAVDVNEYNEITRIHNLQIVNGGQTTSAIYAAKKNYKADISDVLVQMKLSVIKKSDEHLDFVSKVAEYANTQNKVNKSDFFSNSPFHKDYKLYSTSTWTPTQSQERHRWFYERVRGEYLNEQAYMSKGEKRKFELSFPRNKKVEKTSLARSEMAWLQKPDIVSKGSQSSFVAFAEYINAELEKNKLSITEKYFKDSISRIIIFKGMEQIVSNASWYHGGFRANIVAYSLAYLSYYIAEIKKYFNFNVIWEAQSIPEDLSRKLSILCEQIFNIITNPPKGHGNPSQWSKKKHCWEQIKESRLTIDIPSKYLISKLSRSYILREEKKQKKVDKSIEAQTTVISIDHITWKKLYQYYCVPENRGSLNAVSFNILEGMAKGKIFVPTDKQAAFLFEAYNRALEEGLVL